MLEYYAPGKPGDFPNWQNRINIHRMGLVVFRYNPFDYISGYKDKPFFMAYADGGYSTGMLQKYYDDIDVEDKDIFIGENASHFDLYYKPEYTNSIVDRITALFKRHM
jgi:hypothetical protein